jgi:N-acetylglutamate synthase-like GNAT family acetyltransferase
MFITRVSRHDRSDLEEFFKAHDWDDPHLDKGVGFIARDGGIVGALRVIEVEPNVVIIEDVVVKADRRGSGIGAQLMQAAMNSRGGRLLLCCHPERIAFYERLGFAEAPFEELPASARAFFEADGAAPHQVEEGHVHLFMTAR